MYQTCQLKFHCLLQLRPGSDTALPVTVRLYERSSRTDHLDEAVLALTQRPQQRLPPLLPHAVEVELERAGREDLPPGGASGLQTHQAVPVIGPQLREKNERILQRRQNFPQTLL